MVEHILNVIAVIVALLIIVLAIYRCFKYNLYAGLWGAFIFLSLMFGFIGVYYHDERRKK